MTCHSYICEAEEQGHEPSVYVLLSYLCIMLYCLRGKNFCFMIFFVVLYALQSYDPMGFPGGSDGKESACHAVDLGLIPGLGRSPGEGNGYPLQYSCLENPMDRGAWWATVHGVSKSQTGLSN